MNHSKGFAMRSTVVLAAALTVTCGGRVPWAATIDPPAFDSPALAAAIRRAAPGDTVRLGTGTYELTEPVTPKSGVKLLGAGQEKTKLVYTGTKPGVLVSLSGCEDVEIAQMTLDGRNNPLVHQGISGSDFRRIWLHHLTIRNLIDALTFLRCKITGNGMAAVIGPIQYTGLEFIGCTVRGNKSDRLPDPKPFGGPAPMADFVVPGGIRVGHPASFRSASHAAAGQITDRLWDFGEGIPEVAVTAKHTFDRPGAHRVTLIVWDAAGRGSRLEKTVQVLPDPHR